MIVKKIEVVLCIVFTVCLGIGSSNGLEVLSQVNTMNSDVDQTYACGLVAPENWWKDAPFNPMVSKDELPVAFDWRQYGGCTPIRNQGSCGSCWAFATLGALECNILIVDGDVVDLSEQWLVSCNQDGWGCDGGWWAHSYLLDAPDPCGNSGAVMEVDFPYSASDEPCSCPYTHRYFIDDWSYIGTSYGIPSTDAIKQAILEYGPVSSAITVNGAFQGYDGGVFEDCATGEVNHGVVIVGWDDTDECWIIKNSWGSGWGENGYMRIKYGCSNIGYAACYVVYSGSNDVSFEFPEGYPYIADPQGTSFQVKITAEGGTIGPSTPYVRWQCDGGVFQTIYMTHLGGDLYEAYLPPIPSGDCYRRYNWYLRAEEETMGFFYDPPTAPTDTYVSVTATSFDILEEEDFEESTQWSIEGEASAGGWEQADPEQTSDFIWGIIQPGDDHTSDGSLCFVTGSLAGEDADSNDVEGGPISLVSPMFDLSGGDGILSYWRWYHMSGAMDDAFLVEISNDNGATWTVLESVTQREEWTRPVFLISRHSTPTAEMRIRFTVEDNEENSLVEALLDDVILLQPLCSILGDMNNDGSVDFLDINLFVIALQGEEVFYTAFPDGNWDAADCNQDEMVDFQDINAFVQLLTD